MLGADDALIAVKRDLADNVVVTVENAKDAEAGLEIVSRLVVVNIGADEDGDPITSCVIEPTDSPAIKAATAGKKSGPSRATDVDNVKRALVAAYRRLCDAAPVVPNFKGKIEVVKLRDEVRSHGLLETDDDGKITAAGRQHWQRAKADLITSRIFHEEDGYFWQLTSAALVT